MASYIDNGPLKNDHKFLRPYNDTARAQISPYRVPDSVLQRGIFYCTAPYNSLRSPVAGGRETFSVQISSCWTIQPLRPDATTGFSAIAYLLLVQMINQMNKAQEIKRIVRHLWSRYICLSISRDQ